MSAVQWSSPGRARDGVRAFVPLALLITSATIPVARPAILVVLLIGTGSALMRTAATRWAWAATIPVAASLAWTAIPAPLVAIDGSDCTDPTSAIAVWRVAETALVLGLMTLLAIVLRADKASLLLQGPDRRYMWLAALGFLVTGPVALIVGPTLAAPFFGTISYDPWVVGAVLPAVIFATANGVLEELSYRGALMGWSGRVIGARPALVGQAVVFGLAHAGPDVAGLPWLLMIALGVGGLLAGGIAIRSGSLLIPIAIHVGLDIPLFYGLACAN
ncbi:MAG: CPBP family intramembrane metalloprotease [Chloroflexota bacterium]|nr:CPBP family intramembrane metalloprotease [Chloroflexota bacterium]